MARKGQGFHKLRSIDEEHRRKQFAAFVQTRRWILDVSQTDIAKRVGLNQSQISRIEQGWHLPRDRHTFEKYADALELEDSDRLEFFKHAGYIVDPSLDLVDIDLLLEDVVGFATDMGYAVYQAKVRGDPWFAIKLAGATSDRIREITRKIPSSKFLKLLLRIHAQVLFEQGRAYTEITFPNEVWTVTKIIVEEIQEIAEICQDSEISGLADHLLGGTYYHMSQHLDSAQTFTRALDNLKKVDDYFLEGMRTLALNWAKLKQEKEFNKVERKIRRLIDSSQFSEEIVCETFEGLGRGEGLLKLPKAFETLQEGWDFYDEIVIGEARAPLRAIQLIRSELEAIQHLEPTDKRSLENLGLKGIRLAQKHGYQRYAQRIQRLLERSLN